MTTVDSHMHVNMNGVSPKALIKYLDKNKIDCCWLLTWEEVNPGPWTYQHLSIEDVYDAYQQYPSRIIPMYAPDPHRQDASTLLEEWHKKGVRGFGELKATLNWDSNEIRSLLSTAERLNMPIVFHMQENERRIKRYSSRFHRLLSRIYSALRGSRGYYDYDFPGYMIDFASLEMSLQTFPKLNFVAHGPMFWSHISANQKEYGELYPEGPIIGEGIIWRLLREYPNLYADLSARSGLNALMRDRVTARRFLTEFEDKILYGSDNFFRNQKELLNSLGLGEAIYQKIYGENACRIIGI